MRTPTQEQLAILDNKAGARIRVVRAAPGSGKTTLVGMLIRKELENWPANGGGIAALSFTRVGGQEIRKEVGYDLSHPHFVGTLDAFLFRFVVRPFLKGARSTWAAPRLIPADWSPKHWARAPGGVPWSHRGSGGGRAKNYNLFEVCFIDEDANGPILAYPRPYQTGIEQVAANDRAGLHSAKQQNWQRFGWVTHADAAFLASELLGDATCGPAIRSLVLRRFPLLIVDELQDTGFFLAKSIRLLLGEDAARGIVVGDPNQAIYEFNGARPALFNSFNAVAGAKSFPLGNSQRCLKPIVEVATQLRESDDAFSPAAGSGGRAFLVRYTNMTTDVSRIVQTIRSRSPSSETKVIARQSKTVEELTARSAKDADSLYCPALNHMYRAVKAFRQGHNVRALANARAALELSVFGHEGVTNERLLEHKIEPRDWKALAIRNLLKCNALGTTANLYDWQSAIAKILDEEGAAFCLPASLGFQLGRLKPQKRNGWDKPSSDFLPMEIKTTSVVAGVPTQTVHAVKGETHDITIFVCPDSSTASRCPSAVWWTNSPELLEERRIAYVAMTRTRRDLVVCVSDACYQRLCQSQAAFVGSFLCQTIDECIAAF